MTDQQCDHGQLYAYFQVTFCVGIDHNSAAQIEAAHKDIKTVCEKGIIHANRVERGVDYKISKTIAVDDQGELFLQKLEDEDETEGKTETKWFFIPDICNVVWKAVVPITPDDFDKLIVGGLETQAYVQIDITETKYREVMRIREVIDLSGAWTVSDEVVIKLNNPLDIEAAIRSFAKLLEEVTNDGRGG